MSLFIITLKDIEMFESIEQQAQFGDAYYQELLSVQQKQTKKATSQATTRLIQMYSDLVQHFDNISEPISVYFQIKLKKIINASAPSHDVEVRKKRADSILGEKKIIKQMAKDGPVEELTLKQIGKVEAYEQKIVNIIDQQKEVLQNRSRKRNLKKSLTKSASCILSLDEFESPDKRSTKPKDMDTLHLFQSLIDQN